MLLKAVETLDYYDYPLLFSAKDKEGSLYLGSLIEEKINHLLYRISPITNEQLPILKLELSTNSNLLLKKLLSSSIGFAKLNQNSPEWFTVEEL